MRVCVVVVFCLFFFLFFFFISILILTETPICKQCKPCTVCLAPIKEALYIGTNRVNSVGLIILSFYLVYRFVLFQFLQFHLRLIESMMVLRPRQGNLRYAFRLSSLMRGFAEHEMNNLKTSLRFPCLGLSYIIDYFSHTSSFSSFPQQEDEVAFFSCLSKNTKMQYAK